MTWRRFGETQQIYYDHMGGSRPRRRLGRLKGSQRETLLKESHAARVSQSDHRSETLREPPNHTVTLFRQTVHAL